MAATPPGVAAAATAASTAAATASAHPSVTVVSPANGATGVARDSAVTADLFLPNSALNYGSVTNGTVLLYRTDDHSVVPAVVNTTGGDDAIILQPSVLLDANTSYTFSVSDSVRDTTGQTIVPLTSTFTTGTAGASVDPSIAFEHVSLPTAVNTPFTCVRVGPDHLLYASSEDGRIFRYSINPDGTLGTPQIITSLQTAAGGPTLLTGFAFDPASTATNVILWVSHGYYAFNDAPDFTGTISTMSGPDLQTVRDAVIHLPRSINDHLNEQPTFGPDGALYWCQGAMTSMGASDTAWGMRSEDLLSAAILRLDVTKVTPGQPLDALTVDQGGTYNPSAAGAPLTLYATGVRNAFQLLWTRDGMLYAPTNGASAGGNTPAGPGVPALTMVPQVESDYLYKITQGDYYGHPDPVRNEFVLDGGNPTAAPDAEEFTAYPVGTQPPANWQNAVFDFGPHRSPDGIIEYSGSAFGGALNGKLLVAEYSAGDDIIALTRDSAGNITEAAQRISGFSGFDNPVNLTEDPATGDLYVAELGAQKLTLLRPIVPHATITIGASLMPFNAVAGTTSQAVSLRISNPGTIPLTIPAGGVTVVNDPAFSSQDAGAFHVVGGVPGSIGPGQSALVTLDFTPSRVGVHSAVLQIQSSDTTSPLVDVSLRGIGTAGVFAGNEPSLQRILDLFDIPDNVGEPTPDSTFMPTPPASPNDEVAAQEFVKAGSGPVTIQPLAVFGIGSPVVERVGYYTPGDPTDRTELFHVSGANTADEQTVNPQALGSTAFDPGSVAFGLYTQFPHFIDNGHERVAYSEDALNTWDTSVPRKMRAYPLKNSDGSVVPNAYVVAFEDYNLQYDSNDIVAIVRNVQPVAPAPVLGLENLDEAPFSDRLIFNRIQITNPTVPDAVHDTDTLRLHNGGQAPLVISGLSLSDPTNWVVVNPPAMPATIAPGGVLDVQIKFIATTPPPHSDNQTNDTATTNGVSLVNAGGVWNGTLSITSNDPISPTRSVQLAGYWQYQTEHENEAGLQTLVNLLAGYTTTIASSPMPSLPQTSTPVYYGEEVASGLWSVADPSSPVTVQQLFAFHTQGNPASLSWYAQGSQSMQRLFQIGANQGQTLFPLLTGSGAPALGSFSPAGAFGFNVDGEFSENSRNTTDVQTFHRSGHAVRFYPVRGPNGMVVPNTWLMVQDYENSEFDNSDFQDLGYLVTNMRPAAAPPAPTDLTALAASSGGINLQWAPVSYGSAVGYNILRAYPGDGFVMLNGAPVTGTSFTDASAYAGVRATYRVTAVDLSTNAQSVATDAAAVAANSGSVPGAPGAPSGLMAVAESATAIGLTWTPVAGAASYHVERMGPGDGVFQEIATGIQGNSFTDLTAVPGTSYAYRVRAENDSGLSAYSGVATASTSATVGQPPPAPSGGPSPSQITAWAPPPGTIEWGTIARGTHRDRRSLTVALGQQFYGFTLGAQSKVVIRLTGLRDDADLALLDASGNMIQTSSHPRRRNEAITLTLGPGTYYIRAYLVGTSGTRYLLAMTDTPIKVRTAHRRRR